MSERNKILGAIDAERDVSALDHMDALAVSDMNRCLKAMGDRRSGLPSDETATSELFWRSMYIRQRVALRKAALTQSPPCPRSDSESPRAAFSVTMKTMPSAEIRVPSTSTEDETDVCAQPSEVRKPLVRTL